MITESSIYWVTRLDHIRALLVIGPMFLTIVFFCLFVASDIANEDKEKLPFYSKLLAGLSFVSFLLMFIGEVVANFIPTTKEMIAIKVIPQIVNGVQKHEIPELALKYVNKWLKEELGRQESLN